MWNHRQKCSLEPAVSQVIPPPMNMASYHEPAFCTQSVADSTFSSLTLTEDALAPARSAKHPLYLRVRALLQRYAARRDCLGSLPQSLSRFLGHRPPLPSESHQHLPIAPFAFLHKIPLRYETHIFATLASFVSILLIEAIMSNSTAFRNVYHSPSIITSFGASAVLVFSVMEAPLAQPRNFILGQLVSAVLAISITKLWVLGQPNYIDHLSNKGFYTPGFINGALCMSLALLGQMLLGAVHPPGGATALAAATDPVIVALSWHYVPVVLVSSIVMLGWALVINNLGRKRYPIYWWSPGQRFVDEAEKEVQDLKETRRNGQVSHRRDIEAVGEEMA